MTRPGTDLAGEVAIQINLAIVHLYRRGVPAGALDQLRPAAARAGAAGDVSGHAHALELLGVAAWIQDSPSEAIAWWEEAELLYSEIGEGEGRARCLQHLGSAAVLLEKPKGLAHLEQSAELRGGATGHPTLTMYLTQARAADLPTEVPDVSSPRHRTYLLPTPLLRGGSENHPLLTKYLDRRPRRRSTGSFRAVTPTPLSQKLASSPALVEAMFP